MKKDIKPHSLEAWLAFFRPKTLWIAATPVLVGTSLSLALAGKFNFWIFLFTLLGALTIQAMSNMVNDYAYNVRKAERSDRVGIPRATTEGWISMSAAKKMIGFMIFLSSLLGIILIILGGWQIALIAVLSIICAYCYMGGPKPIAYTPFGEFLVFLFYGLFAVGGTYWLQTLSFNYLVLIPGVALGLIGAAVLFINNVRDIEHDLSVGRKTLAAVVGRKFAVIMYSFMIYIPFIIVGWLTIFNHYFWPFLFVLLALPRASFLPSTLAKASAGENITFLMLKTVKLEVLFGLLMSLAGLAVFYLIWPLGSLTVKSIFAIPF